MGEMRKAYGRALIELGEENKNIVVLDADLSSSTKTSMFCSAHPERFFNAGIAEQNMMGMAAGLAASGKTVFVSSFAVFGTGRAYEITRNLVCGNNLNVKLVCTHAGVSVGEDGATHQAIEDIAIMRAIPNMRVWVAADAAEAYEMVRMAAKTEGPCYIRLTRSGSDDVYTEKANFEFRRSHILRQGSDISIFACGIMVSRALQAAEELKKEGIDAEIINLSQIKPMDEKAVLNSVKKTNCALACEEHSVIGGMGGALAEIISRGNPVKIDFLGIEDQFGTSGKANELLEHFHLTAAEIAARVREILKK